MKGDKNKKRCDATMMSWRDELRPQTERQTVYPRRSRFTAAHIKVWPVKLDAGSSPAEVIPAPSCLPCSRLVFITPASALGPLAPSTWFRPPPSTLFNRTTVPQPTYYCDVCEAAPSPAKGTFPVSQCCRHCLAKTRML